MSAPTLRIPESLADDPSDVADALEVASALWGKGQSEEAIRWLRRAVAAASEADDAARAAGLAGAAADLEDAIKQPSATPPATPPTSAAPTESLAALSPAAPPAETHVEPGAEASAVSSSMRGSPEPDAPAPRALPPEPAHDAHDAHDAAEATLPDSPAAMSMYANGASSSPVPAGVSAGPTPTASVPPRASSVPAPRSTFAKPPVIHPTHSPTALPDLPPRLRVSVKTSVRDAGLLFVRALADGEEAPPGTLEAFLVREAAEANADAPGKDEGTPEESGP